MQELVALLISEKTFEILCIKKSLLLNTFCLVGTSFIFPDFAKHKEKFLDRFIISSSTSNFIGKI